MMIGARGGGGGDPRLEIFASEAKEFFSSVRAILGEGDATEARSAKINVLLEGFLKSSPRIADLVGDALPLEDSGAHEPEGLVQSLSECRSSAWRLPLCQDAVCIMIS